MLSFVPTHTALCGQALMITGEPLDGLYSFDDLAPATIQSFKEDCTDFAQSNTELIHSSNMELEQVGHDFWLTRNGHGAGFWDRNLGVTGDKLSEAATVYGTYGGCDLYVGDDGLIYC
jgi:hypothetical protein